MNEKNIYINRGVVFLFIACFFIVCAGAFFLGNIFSKSGDFGHSERDVEYRRQMGHASELLESIDGRLGNVHDGLGRITLYLGQDAGDLRRLADRLRIIASEIAEMENDLVGARSDIRDFYKYINFITDFELR
jgi:hypothetical protein